MSDTNTSTNTRRTKHISHYVQSAAQTVRDWGNLVRTIKGHIELNPSPQLESQLAETTKKLDEAKREALRLCDLWMDEIRRTAE